MFIESTSELLQAIDFTGKDLFFTASDFEPGLLEALIECGGPGDATADVEYVIDTWNVTGEPEDCRAYLREYGAWDESELADHDENLQRLVWCLGCDLNESGEAYFMAWYTDARMEGST